MEYYQHYRRWMYDRTFPGRGLKPHFVEGVHGFISWAWVQQVCKDEGGIRCPCIKCTCRYIKSDPKEVKKHLDRVGFMPDYWVWIYNGEQFQNFGAGVNAQASTPGFPFGSSPSYPFPSETPGFPFGSSPSYPFHSGYSFGSSPPFLYGLPEYPFPPQTQPEQLQNPPQLPNPPQPQQENVVEEDGAGQMEGGGEVEQTDDDPQVYPTDERKRFILTPSGNS